MPEMYQYYTFLTADIFNDIHTQCVSKIEKYTLDRMSIVRRMFIRIFVQQLDIVARYNVKLNFTVYHFPLDVTMEIARRAVRCYLSNAQCLFYIYSINH